MNFDASFITYARKPKVGKLEVTKSNWWYIDVEKLLEAFPKFNYFRLLKMYTTISSPNHLIGKWIWDQQVLKIKVFDIYLKTQKY